MLNILRWLAGKKVPKADEIPFSSIELWLEAKLKETELSKELSEIFSEIEQTGNMLKSSLRRIAQIKIELSKEHKNAAEDSREDYILKMQQFLKQIIPKEKDPESIINYAENLAVSLKHINEEAKDQIINELFSEQKEEIENCLEDLRDLNIALNKLIKQELGVFYVYNIKEMIRSIRKKQKTAKELEQQIEYEKTRCSEAEERRLSLETDIDNLKTMPEYEKYDRLLSQRIRLEAEIERETENIRMIFAKIAKILAKYRQNHALAKQYAEDPLNAVQNDRNMQILGFLQEISSNLPVIEPDNEKRAKIIETISNINEEKLRNYLDRQNLVKDGLEQIRKQLMLSNTTVKIEDIRYKMSHVLKQLGVCRENIKKHEKAISELGIEKDLLMLEKKLNLLGRVKIT